MKNNIEQAVRNITFLVCTFEFMQTIYTENDALFKELDERKLGVDGGYDLKNFFDIHFNLDPYNEYKHDIFGALHFDKRSKLVSVELGSLEGPDEPIPPHIMRYVRKLRRSKDIKDVGTILFNLETHLRKRKLLKEIEKL